MDILCLMIVVAYLLVPTFKVCTAIDSIHVSESIRDGSKALVSQDGKYELGFFSPGNSNKRYLGIWFKNIKVQRVVWVANRLNPINDSSGILTLNSTGNLVLTQNGTVVWYTTTSKRQAGKPIAELLNTGNFAVRNEEEANPEEYLWQSFDYPSDTFLLGMKLGWNLRTGQEWRLTAWKNPNDPSPGEFFRTLMLSNYPEFYLMNGTQKFFRYGPWNGVYLSGVPMSFFNSYKIVIDYKFISNKDEIYYTYNFFNNSIINIGLINQTIYKYYRLVWNESAKTWKHIFATYPADMCDNYGICGANANCRILESPICQCLKGFRPKSPQAWNSSDWTKGCVQNKPIGCNNKTYKSNNDSFVKLLGMKVPDTTHTWLDGNVDIEECRVKCLNNCSCMAYANSDIRGEGSGCVMWFGDLIDLRQFERGGQELYIRTNASQLETQIVSNKNRTTVVASKKNKRTVIVTVIPAICLMLLLCTIYFILRVPRNNAGKSKTEDNIETQVDALDLPAFDLPTITAATNNFLIENKIGQGGFGPVYKGKLMDGQEIAVKRLSRSSGQGITEFINEVKLIAKLQHRNLVRLLGCCIQGQERLLVYEYMVNGSLDSFIFDHTKGKLLKWSQRLHIILGIARGLLYLHQDSRLRIIHRDLKASNVLLDDELNPKISDFGMAKVFGKDQTEGNTNRVVGTYGYMAPEYVVKGLFSIKSDVFSFGVLLLEVISGNKNRALYHATDSLNLVGYAWTLWKEGKALQLVDSNVRDSCVASEVLRCIHVSLLCVQQCLEDRPNMTLALRMLENEMELVEPKVPGFFPRKVSNEANLLKKQKEMSSNDELTITSLSGR